MSKVKINTFERKIYRRISEPVNDNGLWIIKLNQEMYHDYKELSRSKFVKLQWLRCIGHLVRTEGKIKLKEGTTGADQEEFGRMESIRLGEL